MPDIKIATFDMESCYAQSRCNIPRHAVDVKEKARDAVVIVNVPWHRVEPLNANGLPRRGQVQIDAGEVRQADTHPVTRDGLGSGKWIAPTAKASASA